jgi:hypothetical protein
MTSAAPRFRRNAAPHFLPIVILPATAERRRQMAFPEPG